jgi:carbon-monoxide dehydrogenase medium subunit
LWTTAVGDEELLTAVTFPVWDGRCGFAVEEVARRHGDFALAGVCVAVGLDGEGRVDRCGIGLFGLGPVPLRAPAAESAALGMVAGAVDPDELGRAATADLAEVPADLHAPADYRRRVGAVTVARAWRRACEEATGG